jgi:hypothetical protein
MFRVCSTPHHDTSKPSQEKNYCRYMKSKYPTNNTVHPSNYCCFTRHMKVQAEFQDVLCLETRFELRNGKTVWFCSTCYSEQLRPLLNWNLKQTTFTTLITKNLIYWRNNAMYLHTNLLPFSYWAESNWCHHYFGMQNCWIIERIDSGSETKFHVGRPTCFRILFLNGSYTNAGNSEWSHILVRTLHLLPHPWWTILSDYQLQN